MLQFFICFEQLDTACSAVVQKEIQDQKMFLLREMCELIDDEETMVKIEAFNQLSNMIGQFTPEEIKMSQIIKAMKHQLSIMNAEVQLPDVMEVVIPASIKIVYGVRNYCLINVE